MQYIALTTRPGENTLENWAKIIDCGDGRETSSWPPLILTSLSAPLTPLDNTIALKQLEKAHKVHCLVKSHKNFGIQLNSFRSYLAVVQVHRLNLLRRGSSCLVEITQPHWRHFAPHIPIGVKSR